MTIKDFYLISILTVSLYSCRSIKIKTIQEEANDASSLYCDCVKENIFRYKYKEDIYVDCNKKVASKHRLYQLNFKLDSLKESNQFDTKLEDSIKIFMQYFEEKSDSCGHLPISKYPSKL